MRSFDEQSILAHLPEKMRLDMALNVHYKTIKNAKLFHGCDPGLIKEIVGRLKPIIYLPGDYICQKGSVDSGARDGVDFGQTSVPFLRLWARLSCSASEFICSFLFRLSSLPSPPIIIIIIS